MRPLHPGESEIQSEIQGPEQGLAAADAALLDSRLRGNDAHGDGQDVLFKFGNGRFEAEVAGGRWCLEEATPTTYAPADPTDPGDAADLSTPQGISCKLELADRLVRHRTRIFQKARLVDVSNCRSFRAPSSACVPTRRCYMETGRHRRIWLSLRLARRCEK
jgi:hypothetical protein